MLDRVGRLSGMLVFLTLVGCSSPNPPASTGDRGAASPTGSAAPRIDRTLIMAGRSEAPSVASRPLRTFGLTSGTVTRLFNAGLALRDGEGNFRPYLAETLPQLDTPSWTVSADGHMETTYRLHPGLVWHDGMPLTADDFVFAYEVYSHPEIGQAASAPIGMIDQVLAPDPRTILIRWRSVYPDAGNLDAGSGGNTNPTSFPPLPRHLLDAPFRDGNMDAFIGLPFWASEYVGLGPYKMDRWEAGAYFEGQAFDQHVLGRPNISRVRMLFIHANGRNHGAAPLIGSLAPR